MKIRQAFDNNCIIRSEALDLMMTLLSKACLIFIQIKFHSKEIKEEGYNKNGKQLLPPSTGQAGEGSAPDSTSL